MMKAGRRLNESEPRPVFQKTNRKFKVLPGPSDEAFVESSYTEEKIPGKGNIPGKQVLERKPVRFFAHLGKSLTPPRVHAFHEYILGLLSPRGSEISENDRMGMALVPLEMGLQASR